MFKSDPCLEAEKSIKFLREYLVRNIARRIYWWKLAKNMDKDSKAGVE